MSRSLKKGPFVVESLYRKVQKLEAACATRKREHAQLHGTTVVQLWKNNLSEI